MIEQSAYSRLETDEEFRGRLVKAGAVRHDIILGAQKLVLTNGGDAIKALDDYAWVTHKMQRRITWVY